MKRNEKEQQILVSSLKENSVGNFIDISRQIDPAPRVPLIPPIVTVSDTNYVNFIFKRARTYDLRLIWK